MTKRCPIMSKREKSWGEEDCLKENCALWDEEREQCCIKSAMISVADKTSGGSSPTAQAYYVPPLLIAILTHALIFMLKLI